MNDALTRVNFDIIRYANCWEDAGMLLHAFNENPASRIAIIASAGDNALALLAQSPETVTAFDISLPQLYLSELKQAAYARLDYGELLRFLGLREARPGLRMQLLEQLGDDLSASVRAYWKDRKPLIERGIIHTGKFERYFRIFRRYCLPLVHSQTTVLTLLQPKSDEQQGAFYQHRWNNIRWRLLMNFFFSKAVLGRAGRDPQFLKEVKISVPQYIRHKAEGHLQRTEATRNHLLRYIFTGSFGELLPHYLRPEYYDTIRANIGRLTLRQATADEVVASGAQDAYCLSNIFEYFAQPAFESTVETWKGQLPSGARLLYWNLMVPRSFSALAPEAFCRIEPAGQPPDAGFFYSAFLNEQRI